MGELLTLMRSSSRQMQFGIAALIIISLLIYHSKLGLSETGSPSSVITKSTSQSKQRLYGGDYHGRSSPDINRVTNSTLGFSNIFVVGLPDRSDKRDALSLTSAATGFHVEFVDGVKGETIPDKAVPFGVDRHLLMETNLGSWRGHMNAVRRIIEEDLETALIMEDDMDWDVRLRSQLESVAAGAREIMSSGSSPSSPYGDEWDVLWLGHCGDFFPEAASENAGKPPHPKYTILNDETVAPLDKITGLVDFRKYPEFTRWVHISGAPICTFAYALTQRGARKMMYGLSVDRLSGPIDNALADMCRDGAAGNKDGLRAKCISVTPPVFFHHKAKGRLAGDSDIQNVDSNEIRQKGTTENIVWSARNNIKNMLMNAEMENQFGEY